MQAFAMFASDLDAASRQQLTRGARLMELLRQKQYSPYRVEDQVVSIWAGANGHLDDIEVADVLDFERALIDQVRRTTNVTDSIVSSGKLESDAVEALETAVAEVKRDFRGTNRDNHAPGHEESQPLSDDEVGLEQISASGSTRAN